MSHLKYSSYPNLGVENLEYFHYNQAVRIPAGADRVEISGQGKSPQTQLNTPINHHLTLPI
jgi:hypothetical protein